MNLRSIFICSFCILPFALHSAPVVSSASGSFTHGSTVTLTGSSLGTKPTAPPLYWDDYESKPLGQSLGASDPRFVDKGAGWKISSANQRVPSSSRNLEGAATRSAAAMSNAQSIFKNAQHLYLNYWWRVRFSDGDRFPDGGSQIKGPLHVDASLSTQSDFSIGFNNWRYGGWPDDGGYCKSYLRFDRGSDGTQNVYLDKNPFLPAGKTDLTVSRWVNICIYVNTGTAGSANGSTNIWVSGKNEALPYSQTSKTGFIVKSTGEQLNNARFYCYIGVSGVSVTWHLDNVYMDTCQARIEIGDNPVYAECTLREIQPPATWENGRITFALNQGAFADGQEAYVFVVDKNGNGNPVGYPVTIGEGGQSSLRVRPMAKDLGQVHARLVVDVLGRRSGPAFSPYARNVLFTLTPGKSLKGFRD